MEVKYGPEIEDARAFLSKLSPLKKVTFVTTSNRGSYVSKKGESPKSTQLAYHFAQKLKERGVKVELFDGSALKIYNCLGCVSEVNGNHCGSKDSELKDKDKNPNGLLRCWASHDYEDDELWKISKSMYESQAIIFFGSQRWGNVNAIYQKIIERLDWIESLHTTLGEKNSVADIYAGMILLGQNWRVAETLEVQKQVLDFFGFKTSDDLFLGWQYTRDVYDESQESYKNAPATFEQSWNVPVFRWSKDEKGDQQMERAFYTFKEFLNEISKI
jgi:multimeric flavodoxin WrbA